MEVLPKQRVTRFGKLDSILRVDSSVYVYRSGALNEVLDKWAMSSPTSSLPGSSGWRLLASNTDTVQPYIWNVNLIQFFPNTDCTGTPLSGGNYLSSGQYNSSGWGPQNAFLNNGLAWGGRADGSGNFYIGMTFPSNYEVGCVKLDQRTDNTMATAVYVQRLTGNGWENVYIGSNLSVTGNKISTSV